MTIDPDDSVKRFVEQDLEMTGDEEDTLYLSELWEWYYPKNVNYEDFKWHITECLPPGASFEMGTFYGIRIDKP